MQTMSIRPMRHSDITRCALIEQEAAHRFGSMLPDPPEIFPRDAVGLAIDDGLAWVAVVPTLGDLAQGFLVAKSDPGGDFYVAELDVHPSSQGLGLGSALLLAAEAAARGDGYRRMVLTTFRDVSWNAPWYARRGFSILAEPKGLTAVLQARLARQRESLKGVRVAMAKPLA